MKVFVSHSSSDKEFARELAWDLRQFGVSVWYDDWEIKVGDSIVEKVFGGIEKSDALIIILSQASVNSRWVKEELNTAIIRRINENDILILPVLKEDCEIPIALKQLRYADFRTDAQSGLMDLLDAIEPTRILWQTLKLLREHHALVIQQIKSADLDSDISEQVEKLHELMSSALDVRCQVEWRSARMKAQQQDFFQKIEGLASIGLDVRSQTWNALVRFRAEMAHAYRSSYGIARILAQRFQERYNLADEKASLDRALDRLSDIMQMICERPIESRDREALYQ